MVILMVLAGLFGGDVVGLKHVEGVAIERVAGLTLPPAGVYKVISIEDEENCDYVLVSVPGGVEYHVYGWHEELVLWQHIVIGPHQ